MKLNKRRACGQKLLEDFPNTVRPPSEPRCTCNFNRPQADDWQVSLDFDFFSFLKKIIYFYFLKRWQSNKFVCPVEPPVSSELKDEVSQPRFLLWAEKRDRKRRWRVNSSRWTAPESVYIHQAPGFTLFDFAFAFLSVSLLIIIFHPLSQSLSSFCFIFFSPSCLPISKPNVTVPRVRIDLNRLCVSVGGF